MAADQEKDGSASKKSPLTLFREKLQDRTHLKETVVDGLKSGNARVRSLAAKYAFKIGDFDLIKKNVLPLIGADKSKKVLRTLAGRITRKELAGKMKSLLLPKKSHGKNTAENNPAAPAAAKSAVAPKAAAEEK